MGKIIVLRLGHRIMRDKRVTTHVALTSRAYGADGIIISGERDDKLIKGLRKFVENWGGVFEVRYERNWRRVMVEWKRNGGAVIHLTAYWINLPDRIDELRKVWREKDLMVVVGSGKVPGEVYRIADYNVAVSNQPHSEVAALATFLDWLQEGRELAQEFLGAKLKIIPHPKGKKVIRLKKDSREESGNT